MSREEKKDLGFRQQSKIEKIVGWGKKCRGRILIVGNDSTKNARRIIKLEVDPTITTRQRIEVSSYWSQVPGGNYCRIPKPANQNVY